ncbi:MAG: Abortive infection protein AbiEi [Candidatus Margulisbacteria bacterium]|nr:Abortive infection protein AbiEi [Candidatus Margulisiibacteriota bacterium]
MKKLLEYFTKNVYVQTKDIIKASLQTRDLIKLQDKNIIHKIKPGLYRLSEFIVSDGISSSLIDVCKAIPEAVICLLSSLEFYDLTTFNPADIYIALPHNKKPPEIIYPPVRIFYFRKRFYEPGIKTITTRYGKIKIYNKEKTICDMFRYRNKLGEDVALEGLKNYLATEERSIKKLREYAEICQVKTVILPYMKAIIA